ncbi:spherulation-specific family 4 protein [Spirillospora sp. NPDC048911]|uniref:spherulation-specific family 4 protein n=1 Tax=Spirillospora sp. NPDC048911 TaxID=3364527 RepID=UPI003712B176
MSGLIVVPAYFPPAAEAWAELADTSPHLAVVNVDGGPGPARAPDFAAVAGRARAAGVTLAGYVDTAYGRRPPGEVAAEVRRYRAWYGVRRVFLDRAAAGRRQLGHYARTVRAVRAEGAEYVVFNHGVHPDPGYAALADLLVTFEGPWSAYRSLRAPEWVMEAGAGRFCHLVYATPRHALCEVLLQARRCNAQACYVTDRDQPNPWDDLPGYYGLEVQAFG